MLPQDAESFHSVCAQLVLRQQNGRIKGRQHNARYAQERIPFITSGSQNGLASGFFYKCDSIDNSLLPQGGKSDEFVGRLLLT